jgi:uncharacterized protein (TIGR03000 family)
MYSVVLIAALASSSASPGWGHRCHGCYSGCFCSCSYQGCYGCSSCFGCTGVAGYGAAGGCYGYHGGCYGAFGNNYMGAYGPNSPYYSTSCYGCYGGYSCYGVPLPGFGPTPRMPTVTDPFPPINPDVKKDPKGEEIPSPKEKKKDDKKLDEARAKVRIEVPVGGKLFVDGRQIKTAPGTRVFQTPVLAPGEAYFYDIRIETDDRSEERRVVIRAGQDALVSFPTLRPAGATTVQVQR